MNSRRTAFATLAIAALVGAAAGTASADPLDHVDEKEMRICLKSSATYAAYKDCLKKRGAELEQGADQGEA